MREVENILDPLELLKDYRISEEDLRLVSELGKELTPQLDNFITHFYEWLETTPSFQLFDDNPGKLSRVKGLQKIYWEQFFYGVVDRNYIESRWTVGAIHAEIGLELGVYFTAMNLANGWIYNRARELDFDKDKLQLTVNAVTKLVNLDTSVVVNIYQRRTAQKIEQQNLSLMELSTPVIRVWEDIVLLPLIGVIDEERASQIIETLLTEIVASEARVAIVDVTGVPVIDTWIARHLLKTVAAAKMLGADVLITGISPETAQTIVKLDITMLSLKTCGTLRAGLAKAYKMIGKNVVSI